MSAPPAPLAIEIRYRPTGGAGELALWIRLTPVDGHPQLEQARHLARLLQAQGGWEVVVMMDGKPVEV